MGLQRPIQYELADFLRQFSFEVEFEKTGPGLIRYKRDDVRVDTWYSGTLGIYRDGKQTFYKNRSLEDLKEIIANL